MISKRVFWSVGALATLAAVVIVGTALAQVVKQGSSGVATRQGVADHSGQEEKRCKASDLIGMKVRGLEGDEAIGAINDVVLGEDGRIKYVAVSFGGFLGLGDKLFAVPFEAIDFVKVDDDSYARIDASEETLKEKQGFNTDKWPVKADHSFANGKLRPRTEAAESTR